MKEIGREIADGLLKPEDVTEQVVQDHLYTKGQPDVDLLIRPSGEYRISNFLIWQMKWKM